MLQLRATAELEWELAPDPAKWLAAPAFVLETGTGAWFWVLQAMQKVDTPAPLRTIPAFFYAPAFQHTNFHSQIAVLTRSA